MILVTGATGNYGKATINFLLNKGIAPSNITALVRDEAKASDLKAKGVIIKTGDYDNYNSLTEAFKGVDKLLLISGNDMINRGKQHDSVIKAAAEADVKHIFYTSFDRKNETDTSPIAMVAQTHISTEKTLKQSGIPYTILRNTIYADFIPMFIGEKVLETGIQFPAGNTPVAFATRNDMAEATANLLVGNGHENKEYVLANSQTVSFNDVASAINKATGKNISYTSIAPEVYIDAATKAGLPNEYAHVFAGFGEAFKQGEFAAAQTDLERILGRKPTTATEFIEQIYAVK